MMGVYFLESGGLIKIGIATDAHKRMNSIQGQCPTKITMIGFVETRTRTEAIILESKLHCEFHEHRHHREWFNHCESIVSYAKDNTVLGICDEMNTILSGIYNTVPKRSGDIDLNGRSVIAEIYNFVMANPDTTVKSISNSLGIYESVINVHLNRLRQAGLVNRIKKA